MKHPQPITPQEIQQLAVCISKKATPTTRIVVEADDNRICFKDYETETTLAWMKRAPEIELHELAGNC